MSQTRYLKSMITPTLVEPTENHEAGVASGVWSTQDQLEARRGGVWPEAGVANPDTLIEGNFSIDVYNGTEAELTIDNGINLLGKGGLVWIKNRAIAFNHHLFDTERGVTKFLVSNGTTAETTTAQTLKSFNNNGFTLGTDAGINHDSDSVAFTFKKAPKFFDIVTYTGNATARTIAHNLKAVPAMMWVKRIDDSSQWSVYHKDIARASLLRLNDNDGISGGYDYWNDTAPDSTVFSLSNSNTVNTNGATYVCYLFADNTSDNSVADADEMIAVGYYTGNGSNTGPVVDLGWEPQFLMIKASNLQNGDALTGSWVCLDAMRGFTVNTTGDDENLDWESSAAEHGAPVGEPNASGFQITTNTEQINTADAKFLYMAIRRPNMATITDATEVYNTVLGEATNANTFTPGFPTDMAIVKKHSSSGNWEIGTRLLGDTKLITNDNNAESTSATYPFVWDKQNDLGSTDNLTNALVAFCFKRAKGFYDSVAYTGTGSARTIAHGLSIAPELMLIKNRDEADNWAVYHGDNTNYMILNTSDVTADHDAWWNDTSPTSSVFTVGTVPNVNGETYIAHLFGTVAGVSKIGTYTGAASGTDVDVDCGFTAGARFILIKRSDTGATSGWHVFNTLRGIVSGNENYMEIHTDSAEQTNADLIDPLASGFTVVGNDANISVENATYIFLAIA